MPVPPTPERTDRGRTLPATVTMPLLTRITQSSLDEDYRHVAERERATGPKTDEIRRPLSVIVVLVFGLLVATAAVETARDRETTEAGRQVLIERIEAEKARLSDISERVATVSRQNRTGDATYSALGDRLARASGRAEQLADVTGFDPVAGPGVRVIVDNADGATYTNDDPGLVQDGDLAELVNGLWQAGATAISVDGQRVTAKSALRNSGPVIRMNGVSLSPPYDVLALGDPRTLQADFALTGSGKTFDSVTRQFGMPVSWEMPERVEIPGLPTAKMPLEFAEPAPTKQEN